MSLTRLPSAAVQIYPKATSKRSEASSPLTRPAVKDKDKDKDKDKKEKGKVPNNYQPSHSLHGPLYCLPCFDRIMLWFYFCANKEARGGFRRFSLQYRQRAASLLPEGSNMYTRHMRSRSFSKASWGVWQDLDEHQHDPRVTVLGVGSPLPAGWQGGLRVSLHD